jgi:hypothetical protein
VAHIAARSGFLPKTPLFSHRGEACRLGIMRNRLANWVIAVPLMFQLVIGVQWQVAHANIAPPERQVSEVDARNCPGHVSKDSRTDERRGARASTSASSFHGTCTPAHKHDCCGSLDCRCHCAQATAVLNLSSARVVGSASFLLPLFDARPPVARTNELFRPPIA